MKYINRIIEKVILEYLENFSVVALTGPRQSGKSTTLQNLLKENYKYITFDDFRNVDLFKSDPVRFFDNNKENIIFDEAQKVPEIFDQIKIEVDNDRNKKGKYILTGSGNFLMMKNITETLAGRIGLLTLLPFQFNEMPDNKRYRSIYFGSYPEQVMADYKNWGNWYSSYIDTYLTKDLRNFSNIGDMHDFTRFIRLLAARTSQILNLSEISRAIGLSLKTVKKWVSILEASYIIFLLEPYYNNYGKRIIKSPKLYFYDTGIVSYFCGISSEELFENGPLAGAIFENYVISEIVKNEHNTKTGQRFYYYRTSNGEEIDMLIEINGRISLLEIKNTKTFRTQMIKSLDKFPAKTDNAALIYRGDDIDVSEKLKGVNYKKYLSAK